jgi:hypothetical protein
VPQEHSTACCSIVKGKVQSSTDLAERTINKSTPDKKDESKTNRSIYGVKWTISYKILTCAVRALLESVEFFTRCFSVLNCIYLVK